MPSQAVRSLRCDFRVWANRRHSGGLGWRARVSGRHFSRFSVLDRWVSRAGLCSPFSYFRFGVTETGSTCDRDRFAERGPVGGGVAKSWVMACSCMQWLKCGHHLLPLRSWQPLSFPRSSRGSSSPRRSHSRNLPAATLVLIGLGAASLSEARRTTLHQRSTEATR